jgi:hypothetical protein
VEESLTLFGVTWCLVWSVTGCDCAGVEGVDIGMIKDDTSPPRPLSLRGLGDDIEEARSGPEAGKCRILAAMNHLESQHAIETDSARLSCVASVIALILSNILARLCLGWVIAAFIKTDYRTDPH